ncbi:NAD-dependent epimerase/dehydratase family protein [Persephonella sp.]
MAVLVTGGAGFIGSHLVEILSKSGEEVLVIDNLSTGRLENLNCSDNVIFIEGDVSNRQFVSEIFGTFPINKVFHLSAVSSVEKSVRSPVETHMSNFDATMYIIEESRKKGISKLVYTSSAAVYGNNLNLPLSENSPVNPITPYGVDKYGSERYVLNAYNLYGLNTTAFRLFNVFGERQNPTSDYSGVISIFIDRIKRYKLGEKTEITIYGDGNQTRDFVYVKDVVDIIYKISNMEKSNGEVYNIGTGMAVSINEIVEILKELVGDLPPVVYRESRSGDIKRSLADIKKIKEIGAVPKFSFKEGLKRVLIYEGII